MSDDFEPGPATRLAHAGRRKDWRGSVVNPPVWRASTILYDDTAALKAGTRSNRDGDHFYGRRGTPTQWSLAEALTDMEPGAEGTMLYCSGVAAFAAALLSVLSPGDHLLMVDSVYDPTRAFCDGFLARWGIETEYYDPHAGAEIDALIRDNTRAIFMESPGSLSFEIQDVPAIVAAATARDIVTLIDNTWATPLFLPAMAMGVDLEIIALTKYVVGHSDVMAGAVIANSRFYPGLRKTSQQLGQLLGPDDAWLAARGLRTLDVRLKQHESSALDIARWLEDRPEVARVLHPALPGSPGHDLWQRDFSGSTGLFSFVLNGGTLAARNDLIDALRLFGIGYSWGGFESLALPVDPAPLRTATKWQAEGPVVRLHIGLEDVADLKHDLEAGFAAWRASS